MPNLLFENWRSHTYESIKTKTTQTRNEKDTNYVNKINVKGNWQTMKDKINNETRLKLQYPYGTNNKLVSCAHFSSHAVHIRKIEWKTDMKLNQSNKKFEVKLRS